MSMSAILKIFTTSYAADGPIHMKLDALVQTDANSDSNDEWKVKLKREVELFQYGGCFTILELFLCNTIYL